MARSFSSPSRISRARIPWAGAEIISPGSKYSVILSSIDSRCSPAAANTMPSNFSSSIFRSLVSTFPRMPTTFKSGRSRFNWNSLRLLPVPITAPWGSSARDFFSRKINTSLGSSRSHALVNTNPGAGAAGISFMLCTPSCISPERSFSSISFTNTPLSPISWSGLSRIRSPLVLTTWISNSSFGYASFSLPHTYSAWVRASLDPLVPIIYFMLFAPLLFKCYQI